MNNKLLIEVGAYNGSDSIKYYNSGYIVYTFEPNKDLYEKIKEYTKHLINYNIYNKAVCLTDGTANFNIASEQSGASSLLEFKNNEELNKYWESRTDIYYSGISYKVETTRLDTFIEENNLQNNIIDFIHIDAQGVDLDVLKSLGKYLINVKEGVVETVFDLNKSIYSNQTNNISELKIFLKENNFSIFRTEPNDHTNCEYNIFFKNNLFN